MVWNKDCAGRYVASFVVDVDCSRLQPDTKAVGPDPGLASIAVDSAGEKIAPPKFLRSALKRIKRLQRSLGRRVKGSSNRQKARLHPAKAYAKVADKRLDVLHKLDTRLIGENRTVVSEDLNVAGMLKNRRLARPVADSGWRMSRTLLESRTEMYGREIKVISRGEPAFRTCSTCGHKDGKKELSVRAWTCPACGAEHDRDINAARTILAAGLAERLNACGAKDKTCSQVSGVEAGTRLQSRRTVMSSSLTKGIPVLEGGEEGRSFLPNALMNHGPQR